MIIVKDDNPDVSYAISGVTATDAEGNTIPDAQLTYLTTSTDDTVVAVTPDPTDQTKGNAHFGNPGVATVNVQVFGSPDTSTNPLGSFAASFTVTTGDVSGISGGTITFDGLQDNP